MAALRRSGVSAVVSDSLPPSGERFDVAIVQAKWLLDAASDTDFDQRADSLARLRVKGTSIVVDSFDNYFLNESQCPVRQQRLERYREALALADRFVVSSPGLVPLLARELPRQVAIDVVGDPVEHRGSHRSYEPWAQRANPRRWADALAAKRLCRAIRHESRSRLQLLWFGNQGSNYAVGGMSELEPLLEHLAAAHQHRPLQLRVVSNSRPRYEQVLARARFPHTYVDWHRLYFADLLAVHDLVLIPNRLSDFTTAKSNNRLLLALAHGVPVMADALPDYEPWQAHFARSPWSQLPGVLDALPLWRDKAAAAVPEVQARYGIEVVTRAWLDLVAGMAPARRAIAAEGPRVAAPGPDASAHSRF